MALFLRFVVYCLYQLMHLCGNITVLNYITNAPTRFDASEPSSGSFYIVFVKLFIHLAICLTIGPKPHPKPALHIVRSRASSFKWEYPLLSLRSSCSFLRLLATSISPFTFPSITCFRRQFLRKMWPIQLAFRLLISCRIFLCSLTLSNTYSFLTWSVQMIFSILLQHHISKLPKLFLICCTKRVKFIKS